MQSPCLKGQNPYAYATINDDIRRRKGGTWAESFVCEFTNERRADKCNERDSMRRQWQTPTSHMAIVIRLATARKSRADPSFQNSEIMKPTPQERTRAQVYATGNKWAIENYEATHS